MKDNFNENADLVKTVETSVNGVLTISETTRGVFVALASNIRTVQTQAGTTGIGIEVKLKLPDVAEYEGEKFIDFRGERFEIKRTYQDGYMLELTCKRGVR